MTGFGLLSAAATVIVALVFAWALPAGVMRLLLPALDASPWAVLNYRGRRVALGLGVVWGAWAVGIALARVFVEPLAEARMLLASKTGLPDIGATDPLQVLFGAMPLVLVVGSLAFGLIDDAAGTGDVKGFRGHLAALREGRLTTGGLKLVGIGLLSFAAAGDIANFRAASDPWLVAPTSVPLAVGAALHWFIAAATIALTANFVNLLDLRPGRALKAYIGIAVPCAAAVGFNVLALAGRLAPMGGYPDAEVWAAALALLVIVLGPVAAVWRADLSERAMLGDAGANAMGVLAGWLIAMALPPVWLVVVFGLLLVLNLTSEVVSFSAVIEQVRPLRWIDMIGRHTDGNQ